MSNIKTLLTAPFSVENYNRFTLDFFNEYTKTPLFYREPPASFKNTIKSYAVHGTYKDINGDEIIILSVKVIENSQAKQAQRNFISYLLMNEYSEFSAAFVAYYDDIRSNWKLSFVTVEYEMGDKGIELKFKPAKRFSFLVGVDEPTKTYVQQLEPIYSSMTNPTLEEITEAFSISRLSKDFYEEYKKKFFELVDYLVANKEFVNESKKLGFDNTDKFAVTFAKKTLGQIVFLHFVQKKGWLGVSSIWGDGDKNYIYHSTQNFNGDNYFDDFLEPLFYQALNKKRTNDEYLGKKVPFLNGGLFHPIENYDWNNCTFDIPNDYWFNNKETGLLDVLSQYNFTVDESDPSEQEVAIDPEMLGKIFESLLDTNDRSSLGAFYTPREIVHYMCEESLASRISTVLDLNYDSIINYIRYGDALQETEFIESFAEEIDDYISKFTIVDPAVGSGAFLVGMLNQIVKLRVNLMQYTKKNIDKYQIKLEAIQNSLYGVDIEYDAVEIAKLRLWLSLIVDQDTEDHAPRPLPNLNFCLRVGNSLVDTFEGIKLWNTRWRGTKKTNQGSQQMNIFNVDTVSSILQRLKDAKVKYFNTSDEEEKQRLFNIIEREQIELIRSELVAQQKFDVFDKIENMLRKKTKPFFIWELEFEEVFENGGFDIVIANPPYVQLQKDGGRLANELKDQGYQTFTRMGDIYCIFYEKGIDLLKKNGTLCYITSNKWMRAGYGEKLRGFLSEKSNPLKLIDFGGNKVFESATVDVNILLAQRGQNEGKTLSCTIQDDCTTNLSDYITQNIILNSYLTPNNWVILSKIEYSIFKKIEKYGTKLSEWDIAINYGVKTGYNDAFIIDSDTRDKLISLDPKSAEIIRPILRGKDINKYNYTFANKWIIIIPCGFTNKNSTNNNKEKWFANFYPAIYNYLIQTENKLSKSRSSKSKGLYKRDDQGDYWWELRSCKYMDDLNKQKIVYSEIVQEPKFYLDSSKKFVPEATAFLMTGENLEYLFFVLNSDITFFLFKTFYAGGGLGSSGIRYKKAFLLNLPIPMPQNNDYFVEIYEKYKEGIIKIDEIKNIVNKYLIDSYHLNELESRYILI